MSLEGMVFVITGGSSGIGAATAAVAAESGAKVAIGSRSVDRGSEVVRQIAAGGGQAIFQRCDVGVEQDVCTLMEAAADTYGGIDVLVCNAGVTDRALTGESDLEHMDVADFRRVLDVNLVGAWLCAKYALPYLKESDNASIVMAGSSASFLGFNGLPAYVSAKAGLSVLTKELAVELSRFGIRVNCYCPHTIRTPMVEGLFAKAPDPEEAMAKHAKTALVRRFGTPREVAQLICFLAGREAAYINGVSIPIDGGTLAWRGTVDRWAEAAQARSSRRARRAACDWPGRSTPRACVATGRARVPDTRR